MLTIYKLRSTKTWLFSSGGAFPRFTKNGKIWKRKSDLSCHFNQLPRLGVELYKDHGVEILEFEVKEELANIHTYDEWMDNVTERKQKRKDEARARYEEWKRQNDLKELNRLKVLYPDK